MGGVIAALILVLVFFVAKQTPVSRTRVVVSEPRDGSVNLVIAKRRLTGMGARDA
jgi:hypothetical protein